MASVLNEDYSPDETEYIKIYQDLDVHHEVDGWLLVDMEWYPEDGMSCFQYERTIAGVGVELAVKWREQPIHEGHDGWATRNRDVKVLGFTDRDLLRIERGLYNEPVEIDYD